MLLNKNNLTLANLASKEESRYTLNGIHVTSHGTEVTDGHRAVKVSAPDNVKDNAFPIIENVTLDASPDFILPTDIAKRIASAIPKKSSIPALSHALVGKNPSGKSVLSVTDLDTPVTYQPRMVEGQFPNLASVWPSLLNKQRVSLQEKQFTAVSINAQYLIDILRELVAFQGDTSRDNVVRIVLHGDGKPVELKTTNDTTGQTFDAIVMPLRDDGWKAKEDVQAIVPKIAVPKLDLPVTVALKSKEPGTAEKYAAHVTGTDLMDDDLPK